MRLKYRTKKHNKVDILQKLKDNYIKKIENLYLGLAHIKYKMPIYNQWILKATIHQYSVQVAVDFTNIIQE
jgi:hypothetical protein